MELKIVNQTAPSFNEAIGITEERRMQLVENLDQMTNRFRGQTVRTCDVFAEIATMCNNPEELVFCTMIHTTWWARKGFYLG